MKKNSRGTPDTTNSPAVDISIVLPVHNEEKNIGVLLNEIAAVFESTIRRPYEIIVVDDGSDDASLSAVDDVGKAFERTADGPDRLPVTLHVESNKVRLGQSRSLLCGINRSRGNIIVTMDADLQHDPADIPVLLEKMGTFDMVCGIRKSRSDGRARLVCSTIANGFRNWITGDSITDSGCTFRAMRKACIPAILPIGSGLYGCEFFFHPLFVRRSGFSVGETPVNHRQRASGKSNYKLMRGRFMRGIAACIRVRKLLLNVRP